jgi:hypothetical protein
MSTTLNISERLLNISRQTSIKTIYDALVELITNSDDAYGRINEEKEDIKLKIVRSSFKHEFLPLVEDEKRSSIYVIDQASGMTYEEMSNYLLTVGNYTSSDDSRGMMGRGAKDCSVLGDVIFTSVKDGKLSQLVIYKNLTADVILKDTDASMAPELYGILKNGTSVELRVEPSLIPEFEKLMEDIQKNISLRKILANENVNLTLMEDDRTTRLTYSFPEGTIVMECDFDIPEYETTAHIKIMTLPNKLPIPSSEDQREYGILVSSGRSVYECSALYYSEPTVQNLIWNPNIQNIVGTLECDLINKLAKEAANGNITKANPYIIIDPNRRNGLDITHPFTKALYENGYRMLNIVLGRMQDLSDEKLFDFSSDKNLFDGLNSMMSDLLPDNNVVYSWRSREDTDNITLISSRIRNVSINADFLGINLDQIKELRDKKWVESKEKILVGTKSDKKSAIKITFTNNENTKSDYQIMYMLGYINIKINAKSSLINKFLSIKDGKVNFNNKIGALMGVGSILNDAIGTLIVRNKILKGETKFLTINDLNEYNAINDSARALSTEQIFTFMHGAMSVTPE